MRFLLAMGMALLMAPALADTLPAPRMMVVAGHKLAAEAGMSVLRDGGSAVDAAIAMQMVLTLVEPQSSGIGGGAVALTMDGAGGAVQAWDGRETAPAAAGADLFLGRDGRPMRFLDAGLGGRAVGVPGVLRMLEQMHRRYGKLPWDRLFVHAIRLAESGFSVSPRLSAEIAADADRLKRQPGARAYFFAPDGAALAPGAILVNRRLADTFRAIAVGGADALYRGPIAADIVAAVRGDENAGLMTADDLAAYQSHQRSPVCGPYRAVVVCGMGPPSSGGIAILQILGLLEHHNLSGRDLESADVLHLLLEAEKLAHADRLHYVADQDFLPVPIRGLLDPAYLTARAQLIDPDRAAEAPRAGNPRFARPNLSPSLPQPEHGTSHLAVVDAAGNAVSMTMTVQDRFGSRLLVRGFMLNNELTDFSFVPQRGSRLVANRVEGGKRPRSSMSPTIVLRADGKPILLAGSPGGGRIIGYMAQTLVRMIDGQMAPQAAISAPHVQMMGDVAELEAGTSATELAPALRERGHKVALVPAESGLQVIAFTPAGLVGGADLRREGVVLSQ